MVVGKMLDQNTGGIASVRFLSGTGHISDYWKVDRVNQSVEKLYMPYTRTESSLVPSLTTLREGQSGKFQKISWLC